MYVSKIRFYAIGGKWFNFVAKVQLFSDICKKIYNILSNFRIIAAFFSNTAEGDLFAFGQLFEIALGGT